MANAAVETKRVIRAAKQAGFSLETGFKQVAFVFDHLASSQASYTMIETANQYFENNFGINISVFVRENIPPCYLPHFAIFNVRDLRAYEGAVIATSILTMVECEKAVRASKFFYIYDIEWTRPSFKFDAQIVDNILRDENIVKFTRCQDYAEIIKSSGYKLNDTIVPDFDIDKILSILQEEQK